VNRSSASGRDEFVLMHASIKTAVRRETPDRVLAAAAKSAVALAVGIAVMTAVTYLAPNLILAVRRFESSAGREYARALIEHFRPLGVVATASLLLLAWLFADAREQARIQTAAGMARQQPPDAIASSTGWWIALSLVMVCALAVWLWPLFDGLQDDEADKLLIAVGDWRTWYGQAFNPRYNILPITVARSAYLLIGSTHESLLLRLPVFLTFGAPFLLLVTRRTSERFGAFTALLLLIFYGLDGTMGEYASKVQGYLAVLAFATAQLLLWSRLIRYQQVASNLRVGAAYVAICLGGYLSHNFVVVFVAAQLTSAISLYLMARARHQSTVSAALTAGYAAVALALMAGFSLFGIGSVLSLVRGGAPRDPTVGEFVSVVTGALGGPTGALALVGLTSLALFRVERRKVMPELLLGIVTMALIGLVYWVARPQYFIARFLIWLPLVWLIPVGNTLDQSVQHVVTGEPLRVAFRTVIAAVLALAMLPSQFRWQVQRGTDPNLRTAANAALRMAAAYRADGHSVGFLLLRSDGNYSHRMWFYFRPEDFVSDRGVESSALAAAVEGHHRDIWLVPAAYGRLAADYEWISEQARERTVAGNMVVYAVSESVWRSLPLRQRVK